MCVSGYAHAERVLDADEALLVLEERAGERDGLVPQVLGLESLLVHELLELVVSKRLRLRCVPRPCCGRRRRGRWSCRSL